MLCVYGFCLETWKYWAETKWP